MKIAGRSLLDEYLKYIIVGLAVAAVAYPDNISHDGVMANKPPALVYVSTFAPVNWQ